MSLLSKYLQDEREKRIKPFVKGNVLDIGCGPANALKYPSTKEYFGVEFSKEAKEDHKAILTKKDFLHIAKKYNLKMERFSYFEFFCNQLVVYRK